MKFLNSIIHSSQPWVEITMTWNRFLERWVVKRHGSEANIYELPDCQNFRNLFPGVDKSVVNIYKIRPAIKLGQINLPEGDTIMSKKLDMTITLVVSGEETVTTTLDFKGTTKENVVAVENSLMTALQQLNLESLK